MRTASNPAFDTLLDGLGNALDGARRAARQRYEAQLLAFVHGGMRSIGPVQAGVSVASLRAFRQVRVRGLSIEFDCMVRTCRKTSALLLRLRKPRFWEWQQVHRVLVELDANETTVVQVSIDGKVFRTITHDGVRAMPDDCVAASSVDPQAAAGP